MSRAFAIMMSGAINVVVMMIMRVAMVMLMGMGMGMATLVMMMVTVPMRMIVGVIMRMGMIIRLPVFNFCISGTTSTYAAHQFTSSSRIFNSSPPVTCN